MMLIVNFRLVCPSLLMAGGPPLKLGNDCRDDIFKLIQLIYDEFCQRFTLVFFMKLFKALPIRQASLFYV